MCAQLGGVFKDQLRGEVDCKLKKHADDGLDYDTWHCSRNEILRTLLCKTLIKGDDHEEVLCYFEPFGACENGAYLSNKTPQSHLTECLEQDYFIQQFSSHCDILKAKSALIHSINELHGQLKTLYQEMKDNDHEDKVGHKIRKWERVIKKDVSFTKSINWLNNKLNQLNQDVTKVNAEHNKLKYHDNKTTTTNQSQRIHTSADR